MTKKVLYLLALLPVVLVMAGCSNIKLPAIFSKNNQSQQNQGTESLMDLSKQPVENKLAIGILSLEGTDKAVTAEEAKNLLPLWKAVKSLSSSTSTSDSEITALYKQIEETLTAEQVQAIKDLNLSQDQMRTLLQKYGGFPAGGGQDGANPSDMTDEQRATLQALRRSNNNGSSGGDRPGGNGDGGFPPGGGEFPGGQRDFPGAGQPNAQQGPPSPNQANRPSRAAGLNVMLADPLIKLLQERAGE